MRLQPCKTFPILATIMVAFSALAFANSHHDLNGTWRLVPTRSEFAGEPMIQTGTLTINDREGNIYVSRNFSFDGENQSVSYSFSTDARENTSIHEGKAFKSKAKWEGPVLKVVSTQDNITSTERYRLSGDGTLMLTVDRPGHRTISLFFERQ